MVVKRKINVLTDNSIDHSFPDSNSGTVSGYVLSAEPDVFIIQLKSKSYSAKRAVSCLVRPQKGDYVGCLDDGSNIFIISVLKASCDDAPVALESKNPISIDAPALMLLGRKTLKLFGQSGFLNFNSLDFVSGMLSLTAEKAETRVETFSHFGKSVKTLIGSLLSKAGNSLRVIDGPDVHKAKETELSSEKMMSLKGEVTSISARKDIRIDGERVHLG